ncbi:MAG TPA: leucine--tRNA ligase [Jiangellaceae bacterium]|nr:leucine--tRNA ligase [Jiangellaceae bacterium]
MAEQHYDPTLNADRWIALWDEREVFAASALTGPEPSVRPRTYVVNMLPYPSGDLHMGHAEAYSIGDAIARFARMRGHDVLNPIGWDSFGLPAENAAIRRGLDPREWTYANIETQARAFRRLGISFDWRTRLHTSDPEFYRWNQWLFLRMHERGLAYRAAAPVNWCPTDRTVLANEQVVAGRCERCRTTVVRRELTQWFLRITAYADRLLSDMDQLANRWPSDVLAMQRNWIGRSEGPAGVSYRLRDWLISRQRFWGTPIPIVHCPSCGPVPVPDDELPVRLPQERLSGGTDDGESPLAGTPGWVEVTCPSCSGWARRDTDTMDTLVDSSWYFLRYPNPHYADGPFDPAGVAGWLPVDEYIGGKEHATGHLLYARFITKLLHDLGLVTFTEPFTRLTNQGQVIMNRRAMSKSKGNMVDLQDQIDRYGPDAVRVTMLFAGPPEDDIDWADVSVRGAVKWLARVWRLAGDVSVAAQTGNSSVESAELRREVHRLIDQVTQLMEARRFNVAIARLMELTSRLRRAAGSRPGDPSVREGTSALVRMLSCFAPFMAEDAWDRLGEYPSAAEQPWPSADPALVADETVTCVVQIAGKVRARIQVPPGVGGDDLKALVLSSPAVLDALDGVDIDRMIVRPPGLVNIVPSY